MPSEQLTDKQLRVYFDDYAAEFPTWNREHDVVLARTVGPITQRIGIESLRTGAYRSWGSVEVGLVPVEPNVRVLYAHLDVKHREIRPRQHASMLRAVIAAMEQQFEPPIRSPLDARDVLRRAEEQLVRDRIENENHECVLAALNAFLGNNERALHWCKRVADRQGSSGTRYDWQVPLDNFARELCDALIGGRDHPAIRASR